MDDKSIGWVALGMGGLIIFAGTKGYSILKATQNIVSGKPANAGQNVSLISGGDSGASGTSESISPGAAAAKKWAKAHLSDYGWGPEQFAPLDKLWTGESGWRVDAFNSRSGATGIPQALPGSKMASEGADWKTNPVTQMKWGMRYIKDRPDYGTPARAYALWQSRNPHWY
jgi:hypothetical protein